MELEPRRVREENVSRVAAGNQHEVQVKNLEKKVDEKKLSVMTLLRELKKSMQTVKLLERENELLRETSGGALDSAVREAGTSPMHAEWLLEALDSQYIELAIVATKRFATSYGKGGLGLCALKWRAFESGYGAAGKDPSDLYCREKEAV